MVLLHHGTLLLPSIQFDVRGLDCDCTAQLYGRPVIVRPNCAAQLCGLTNP